VKAGTILGEAARTLKRTPARSGLTALGIVVGVAAIITTDSIGRGAKVSIEKTLEQPETRVIYLGTTLVDSRQNGGRTRYSASSSDGLTASDYYAIRRSVDHISAATPKIYRAATNVQANGHSADAIFEGVDVDAFVTQPVRLLEGTLFNSQDVQRAANVCLVSEFLAEILFGETKRIGRLIRIGSTSFTILGVVSNRPPPNLPLETQDLHLYVPFTSALRRVDRSAKLSVNVQATDIASIRLVQQRITDLMEQRRSGRRTQFLIRSPFDSIKTYAEGSLAVARLLAAFGAISLIVGGIGIMNIMLVSVAERTREIGIRMALGTRGRHVLMQFVIEAVALSLMGGGLGVTLGWIASELITGLYDWPTSFTISSVLIALCCSLAVGVLFGYSPARRAAYLRPVEALHVRE
jgi:putative ABC transport system permease protein